MTELFDIIKAINFLKDQISVLNTKIDHLCKYPALVSSGRKIPEESACKILGLSYSEIRRLRINNEITFIRYHRRIYYTQEDLNEFIEKKKVRKID